MLFALYFCFSQTLALASPSKLTAALDSPHQSCDTRLRRSLNHLLAHAPTPSPSQHLLILSEIQAVSPFQALQTLTPEQLEVWFKKGISPPAQAIRPLTLDETQVLRQWLEQTGTRTIRLDHGGFQILPDSRTPWGRLASETQQRSSGSLIFHPSQSAALAAPAHADPITHQIFVDQGLLLRPESALPILAHEWTHLQNARQKLTRSNILNHSFLTRPNGLRGGPYATTLQLDELIAFQTQLDLMKSKGLAHPESTSRSVYALTEKTRSLLVDEIRSQALSVSSNWDSSIQKANPLLLEHTPLANREPFQPFPESIKQYYRIPLPDGGHWLIPLSEEHLTLSLTELRKELRQEINRTLLQLQME